MDEINSIKLSSFSSSEQILTNQAKFQNDISYMCSAIRYLQQCNDSYSWQEWPLPLPYGYAQPLPPSGPLFDPWITPLDLSDVHRLIIDPQDDAHFASDMVFIPEQD